MCADAARLEDEVRALEEVGADYIHFDLMDSHFVPNMPLGLGVLSALRSRTSIPFDVHLMVERNDWFIDEVASIGAEMVSVHVESATHLDRSLALIRSHGIRAGAALNPATPLNALDYVIDRLDHVLLMTVNPGFAGQKLVPATLQKIADCRSYVESRGSGARIEVDGNVSLENAPRMVAAGADMLVAGSSSLYRAGSSIDENMKRLRAAVLEGLRPDGESRIAPEDPAVEVGR